RYLQHQLGHLPPIKTYANTSEPWCGLEAGRIAVSETAIYLILLFGHTLGHCGEALKSEIVGLFYLGDAYYLKIALTDHVPPDHPVGILAQICPHEIRQEINVLLYWQTVTLVCWWVAFNRAVWALRC